MIDLNPPILRPYQEKLIADARAAALSQKPPVRLIVQAETGAGKGKLAAKMICNAIEMGKTALFIARGRLLVSQFEQHMLECGVEPGIIMAGRGIRKSPVQIASKDTFAIRYLRDQAKSADQYGLVIADEIQDTTTGVWKRIIAPQPFVVGFSATPATAKGGGLGDPWKGLICCAPPSQLIADGWIVPSRVFAPYKPDLKGVEKQNGDYVVNQLASKMDRPSLVGDVVRNWLKYGEQRPTLVFAVNIEHAKHIRDKFREAGISARHIDQTTPDNERTDIFAATTAGMNKVITNVMVMSRGVDLPCISCIVLARPTESFVLFRQSLGRGKRPWPGKTDLVVIDHAGACYRHSMPDDDVEWKLGGGNVQEERDKARKEGRIPEATCCPKCFCMFVSKPACPNCGHVCVKKPTRSVQTHQGLLVPVGEIPASVKLEERIRYWKKCLFVMAHKRRTFSAARSMYFGHYKEWPAQSFPMMPPPESWNKPIAAVYPGMDPDKMKDKRGAANAVS